MSSVVPSPDSSLVVFRVECSGPQDGRLAVLGRGVGLGNWNNQAARMGVNYPVNSATWYIPVLLDLTKDTDYTAEFVFVKLDQKGDILEEDPVGHRIWVLPNRHCAYFIQWGRAEAAEMSVESLPTKNNGVDLGLTAWTSHVVGHIKSLHLSKYHYDFTRSSGSRPIYMKKFTYHPSDFPNENTKADQSDVPIDVEDFFNLPSFSLSSPAVRGRMAVTPIARRASRTLRRGFSSIGKAFVRLRPNSKSSSAVGN